MSLVLTSSSGLALTFKFNLSVCGGVRGREGFI